MSTRFVRTALAASALTVAFGASTAQAQQRTLTGTAESGLHGSQRAARTEAESIGLRQARGACAMHRAGETLDAGTESHVNCDSAGGVFGEPQYQCEVIWYARCAGTQAAPTTRPSTQPAGGDGSGEQAAAGGTECAGTVDAVLAMAGAQDLVNGAVVCAGEGTQAVSP